MSSITQASASIQTSPELVPAVSPWFGEVVAHFLVQKGILGTLSEHVRFARKRFDTSEVIDFLVVLIGYALSGEPMLTAYCERLRPFSTPFMALFGRCQLPHRSTLSRFLAALDSTCVEALRAVFLQDALTRPGPAEGVGGLWDRQGKRWVVFDLDATRQAARQRALPQTPDLPAPQRRLRPVCAWLHRTQARRGDSHPHNALTSTYPPVALHLWDDWQRCQPRRAWTRWLRHHQVVVDAPPTSHPPKTLRPFTRAQRAHWRLSWKQRLSRNARPPVAPPIEITVYWLPTVFAQALGLPVA